MPIQLPLVFLLIAQHKDINTTKLMQLTRLSQSSVSRNIAVLTKEGREGEPGLGLVVKSLDPLDTRVHRIHLTKAGRALAQRLAEVMGRSVRLRTPVGGELEGDAGAQAVSPATESPKPFAGAHWEVWVD